MGLIDIEHVGANRGIDESISVPFPCYDIRISNANRRGVYSSILVLKPNKEMDWVFLRFYYGICLHFRGIIESTFITLSGDFITLPAVITLSVTYYINK